jgi:CRP-like cAMP-binding protein
MTSTEILRALPASVHCSYPSEAAVVKEGERGSEVYAVLKGSFSVRYSQWVLFTKEIARLKPGELFGEIGILSPGARLASVVTIGTGEALRIAAGEFRALLNGNPELSARVEEQALQRIYGLAKGAKAP